MDNGAILSVKLQLQEPATDTAGREYPEGHILTKQIRFIPSGNWTIESAKQELRKLQLAALQKPFSSTEALPPFTDENKETYVGKEVELQLKIRAVNTADGVIQYQDCKFRALPKAPAVD